MKSGENGLIGPGSNDYGREGSKIPLGKPVIKTDSQILMEEVVKLQKIVDQQLQNMSNLIQVVDGLVDKVTKLENHTTNAAGNLINR